MKSIREEVVSFNISLDDLPDGYSRLSDNGMEALEVLIAKVVEPYRKAICIYAREFMNPEFENDKEAVDFFVETSRLYDE